MCRRPACSQPAERSVHQRPARKTGPAPLAPKRMSASWLGANNEKRPLLRIPCGSTSSMAR